MKILLLYYNKVTDQAFDNLQKVEGFDFKVFNLRQLDTGIDTASYNVIDRILSRLRPFDAVLIGDIFWPTGQNICRWCKTYKVFCGFIQHGQWIYVANKMNPKYLPTTTFVYGYNIRDEIKSWPYGKKSEVVATGNPRYDNVKINQEGDLVYLAPPVICEENPSSPNKFNPVAKRLLEKFSSMGGDKLKMVVHPHYRERETEYLKKLFPNSTHVDRKDDPFNHIRYCKAVLTHRNSTTILDAIAHGKLSVLLNGNSYPSYFPMFYFADFTIESDRIQECLEFLKYDIKLDYDNYQEKAAEFIVLGNASKRILNHISGKV